MHARMDLQAGAIECMCMALKQFPKKKESVLSLCGPVWYSTRSAPCMSVHANARGAEERERDEEMENVQWHASAFGPGNVHATIHV
jgi:hypothetical protein